MDTKPTTRTPATTKPVTPTAKPIAAQPPAPKPAPKPAEKGPATTPRSWGVSSNRFFRAALGQTLQFTMQDGKVYTLTLIGVDNHDLICQTEDGQAMLLFKHAIQEIVLPREVVLPSDASPASSES